MSLLGVVRAVTDLKILPRQSKEKLLFSHYIKKIPSLQLETNVRYLQAFAKGDYTMLIKLIRVDCTVEFLNRCWW